MFSIRSALAHDAAAISSIACEVQALHAAAHPTIFKPPGAATFPPETIVELMAMPGHHFFVAASGDTVAGYLYAVVESQPATAWKYATTVLTVEQMGVHDSHRAQGLGERLLRAAHSLAQERGVAEVRLSVWAFNDGARRFYDRHGYAVYQERRRSVLPQFPDRVP